MLRSLRAPSRRLVLLAALVAALVGAVVALPGASPAADAATTTSGNLLTGDTASLTRVGTWTGTNAKLSVSTVSAEKALVVKASKAGTAEAQTGKTHVKVVAGEVYTASLLVRNAGATTSPRAVVRWYDARGREISAETARGPAVPQAAGTWHTSLIAVGIAPAGAAYVALGASFPVLAANETHYLARPTLTVTAGGSSAVAGPLRTVGNKIVDAQGEVVVLRGVNRSGAYNSTDPDTLSQYDFSRIKAWGANSVRITIAQYTYLPGCPAYDPKTAGIVDTAVKWANDLGMVAILDLQWNAPTCDTNGLNPMPDPQSKVFWQTVAARYANAPLVAFDLFNEPHSVTDEVWANGGTAQTASGVTYQAIGMKELYDTVRATGAENLVFIGGNDYASTWPTTAPLPATTNVVYAVHAYNCDAPTACTFGTGSSWLLERFVTPGKTSPIMITEFGWPTSDERAATQFNNGVIAFAEAQGWGWMPWSWQRNGNCKPGAWWSLVADGTCDVGDAYQPTAAGLPVLRGLQHNR